MKGKGGRAHRLGGGGLGSRRGGVTLLGIHRRSPRLDATRNVETILNDYYTIKIIIAKKAQDHHQERNEQRTFVVGVLVGQDGEELDQVLKILHGRQPELRLLNK